MEDVLQEIEVCFRNRLKEITAHNGNPLLKTESRSLGMCTRDNLWAIEHDTVKVQMKLQQGMKHRATSAADIGHSFYTTRVDKSCRFLCDSGCQTRHRLGEGGGLSGVCRKIIKQPRAKRWKRLAFSRFDRFSEAPPRAANAQAKARTLQLAAGFADCLCAEYPVGRFWRIGNC